MEGAIVVEELCEDSRTAGDPGAPDVGGLRRAVDRLRRQLAVLPGELPDRAVADEELAALAAMTVRGRPEAARLRRSLLLLTGAVGSVSALSPALSEVRARIEGFG